jgi:D-alanine transaminase
VIRTPPKSKHLLPGITRDLVLELARKEGLPWREEEIPREQLHTADEIWITSSTREIVPVTRLDGRPVGNGTPGPIFRSTHSLYCDYKAEIRSSGR